MLKIISCNLNGIRSANKKGFFDWLHKQKADIVCLQELRASSQQINEEKINFRNDAFYIKSAEKKGYSGVGIITKHKPKKVIYSYGDAEFDNEGRYIQLNFENFIVVSLYAPSGSSSEERQKANVANGGPINLSTDDEELTKRIKNGYIGLNERQRYHCFFEHDLRNTLYKVREKEARMEGKQQTLKTYKKENLHSKLLRIQKESNELYQSSCLKVNSIDPKLFYQ